MAEMTPQEALKVIDKVHDYPCPYGIGGTAWMYIRNCIEKQIPKKPLNKSAEYDGEYGNCPCCNRMLTDYSNSKRCPDCGQTLDWSDT